MTEILRNCCVICRAEFLESVTKKGISTLIKSSNIRNDPVLLLYLSNENKDTNPVLVHNARRTSFTDPRKKVTTEAVKNEKVLLRSSLPLFNWKSKCFLCAEDAANDKRHPDRCDNHIVTLHYKILFRFASQETMNGLRLY